jgi:protein-tyrosine phosphatase
MDMDRIMPYPLWLGHAGDGRDCSRLGDAGIQAVVQLAAEEPPLLLPRELISLRFPLVDGAGNPIELLALAVHAVADLVAWGVPTLICCGAGLSRSPAIAAAAISWNSGDTPEESLCLITRQRRVDLMPGLWDGVRAVLASRNSTPART